MVSVPVFGCAVSSFLQTYLGLPLSPYKLRMSDLSTTIAKCDLHLSGWRGRSLPIGGRLILVNSVISAKFAHVMSACLLPASVIEAIDKRRRAFLWTGEETCTGGHCKVAWDEVCKPKKLGGLGVLSISSQNSALLSKTLSKLHSPSDAPWNLWFHRQYGWSDSRDLGYPHYLDTPIWKSVVDGLASFRLHSSVSLANGRHTAFWLDCWIGDSPLSTRFPALFSHTTRPHAQVAAVMGTAISLSLVPRLSSTASTELASLMEDLQTINLTQQEADARVCRYSQKPFTNKDFYANFFRHATTDELAVKVWKNAAPLKCRIFNWLVRRRRLPTNDRRFRHQLGATDRKSVV